MVVMDLQAQSSHVSSPFLLPQSPCLPGLQCTFLWIPGHVSNIKNLSYRCFTTLQSSSKTPGFAIWAQKKIGEKKHYCEPCDYATNTAAKLEIHESSPKHKNKKHAAKAAGSSLSLDLAPFWTLFGPFLDSSTNRFIVRLIIYLLTDLFGKHSTTLCW